MISESLNPKLIIPDYQIIYALICEMICSFKNFDITTLFHERALFFVWLVGWSYHRVPTLRLAP